MSWIRSISRSVVVWTYGCSVLTFSACAASRRAWRVSLSGSCAAAGATAHMRIAANTDARTTRQVRMGRILSVAAILSRSMPHAAGTCTCDDREVVQSITGTRAADASRRQVRVITHPAYGYTHHTHSAADADDGNSLRRQLIVRVPTRCAPGLRLAMHGRHGRRRSRPDRTR